MCVTEATQKALNIPVMGNKMPLMGALDQAVRNRQQIADIKRRYLLGEITREDAKAEVQPIIDRINTVIKQRTTEFNKKHGTRRSPALLNFSGLMR